MTHPASAPTPIDPADVELRFPTPEDEASLRAAQTELGREQFDFAFDLPAPDAGPAAFADWCAALVGHVDGIGLGEDRVPHVFHVAVLDGEIVGRVSIRLELNDFLARVGGHIGYGVRPAWRRRGLAHVLLRHGLHVLADRGLASALVTCDDDNVGSAATIERAGGVLRDLVEDGDTPKRRYDVPTRR